MRKFRQFVALLVTVVTVVSLLTFSTATVTAEETLPQITITDDDLLLIEKLEALGVITVNDVASSYVTRRQMAEIIKKYMGLPNGSAGSEDKQFNDVKKDDPLYGTICALRDLEVITGDENNNFRPDDYLNYNEAVVFVINAVGHKYFALREGGFPTGYMRVAIKHDMLDNLNMTNGESMVPLIDVYRLLDSALSAATIIPQYYGDGSVRYTISETDTFLSENYGINKYRGKVTGNEFTSLSTANFEIDKQQIQIDNVIYDTPGYYYDYFLGYTVDYYVKEGSDGKELMYVEEAPKKNSKVRVDSEDIIRNKVTSSRIYYLINDDEDEEHIDMDTVVDVIYNSQWYSGYGALVNVMPANGYIEALDNDNDGVYEVLFVYDYTVVVVDSADGYEEVIVDEITGTELDLSTNVRKVNIIAAKEMVSVPFDSIKKGDILNIAEGRGTEKIITVYVNNEKVTGKIGSYESNLGYEINGNYYEPTYNYSDDTLTLGLSGSFFLDMSGKIAAYEYKETGVTAMTAAIAGVDYNENSTMNPDVQVKLFTNSGVFITVPMGKNVKLNNVKYDMDDISDVTTVLNILCNGYQSGGKYALNDSYVIRYTLSNEGSISYIDTGAIGGPGNLNLLADHYEFSANRIGIALLAPANSDFTGTATYAPVKSGALIFKVPAAGNLSEEDEYSIVSSWTTDKSYASVANRNSNFPGANTEIIENYSVYHTDSNDVPAVEVMMIRGASAASTVGGDSKMYVVTEITNSADADGTATKTLYESEDKIGQLAQQITVTKAGATNVYTIEQFIAANVLSDGTVIQCATDAEGYINQVSVVADYDAATDTLTPTIDASGSYISTTGLYATAAGGIGIATVNAYDKEQNVIDVNCDVAQFVFDMSYAENIKIYDSATGKIRKAMATEIRDGDKCVLRVKTFFRLYDIIIMR